MTSYVAISERRAVEVERHQPLAVALVLHAVEAEHVAHVGGLPGPQPPPRQLSKASVLPGLLARPVVAGLRGVPGQDPHEAVAVLQGAQCTVFHGAASATHLVVVDGGGHGLRPAHEDQVKLGVSLMHQVPGVFVLVPLHVLLNIFEVKLVP